MTGELANTIYDFTIRCLVQEAIRVHAQRNELLAVVVHELLAAGADESGVACCALDTNQQSKQNSYNLHSLTRLCRYRRLNEDSVGRRC